MLKLADVKSTDVVYDLGCGDGRIVIAAAKTYGARGVGIDINPERIKEAKESAVKLGGRDPNFFQSVRKSMDTHDDPTFKAELARIMEGLRKAGVPEGTAKTN